METLTQFLRKTYLGNTFQEWLIAIVLSITMMIAIYLIRKLLVRKFTVLAERTETQIDDFLVDLLRRTRYLLIPSLSIFFGSQFLELKPNIVRYIDGAIILVLVLQGAFWANASIAYIIEHTMKKRKISGEGGTTTLTILGFLGRVVLWSFVLLTALNYLGINITALVTALGVGGIAIALAVQSLLGDIIGSLSIALDNPFEMGDVIQIDEYVGTVEKVGMKTTRVRSFTGELIIFSNSELLKSRIRNYKRMTERRALLKINVAYNTPHKKLAVIPDLIKEIVEKQLDTRFERAHLRTLSTYACEYEVVFSVLSPDMILYLNVVQEVNLEIIRRFERERIKFALPPYTSAI